jgi:hypothetical protein
MRLVKVPPKISHHAIAHTYYREMNERVQKHGVIRRDDFADLVSRAYDPKTKTVDAKAAEVLASIADEFKPMMDAETKALAAEFKEAYYTDMMSTPVLEEYRRQAKEALAQSKEDWTTFLHEDLKQHEKLNFDDFKKILAENRVEMSEQQAVEMWVKFGHKKAVTST